MPPMVTRSIGYGAGTKRFAEGPNVLPAFVGEAVGRATKAVVLETNVDDVTGEVLAHTIDRLLATGASDAWVTPIVMKKGRPAHTVHVLARVDVADELQHTLLAETGSLGVRRTTIDKVIVDRDVVTVEVHADTVRVKRGPWGAKPEYADVARASAALGMPVRTVSALALAELGTETVTRTH